MDKKMNLKTLCVAVSITLASVGCMAETYQAEVAAGYADIDKDSSLVAFMGSLYFTKVKTDNHPLAEAAFLEDASNVQLIYGVGEVGAVDVDVTSLAVNYYIPNTQLFAGAELSRISAEHGALEKTENDWGLTLGFSPLDDLLLTTSYSHDDGYDFNIKAKYVKALTDKTSINIEAIYEDGDEEDLFGLATDYYLNKKLSIGATLVNEDEFGFGIRSRLFITNQLHISAEYLTVDSEDSIFLEVGFRI